MTVEEANKLLGIVKVNYSYAFKNLSDEDKVMLVKSWAFVFQDIPADIVTLAFMQLLATSKWLPTPAEIREQIKQLYYSAVCHKLEGCGLPDGQSDRVIKYIIQNTAHLRGEGNAELSFDAIWQRGYARSLGTGKTEFQVQEIEIQEGKDE